VIAMRGVITGREVVNNAGLICHEFGVACFMRCLWALASRRSTTFLELACPCSESDAPASWTSVSAHNDDVPSDAEVVKH
jgi:hypothetical protein